MSKPAASTNLELLQAHLVQLREIEAKLEEERQQTQKLRAALEAGHPGRGAGAREVGPIARARIAVDDDVDNPLALNRASQKLTAAALLFRSMP